MTTTKNGEYALLAIQELLDGVEWSPDTLNAVAAVMIDAGYRIRDLDYQDHPMPTPTPSNHGER